MNPKVDLFLKNGCGRCKYYATDKCKVRNWNELLKSIRDMMLESGLIEDLKWGMPVYTMNNKNIVMIAAFKEHCSISFLKGALLNDRYNILQKQGKNGQSVRIFKCIGKEQLVNNRSVLKTYVEEAIANENAGLKVERKPDFTPFPSELEKILNSNSTLKEAFFKLTPGRQRGYLIYFSQPKQSKTIISRIENSIDKILNGMGWQDR